MSMLIYLLLHVIVNVNAVPTLSLLRHHRRTQTNMQPPLSDHPTNIAMPSKIYERTANSAQYGVRMYPTQEDAGSWDESVEPAESRGGDVGFSLTGENMEADLPLDERLPSEESRR